MTAGFDFLPTVAVVKLGQGIGSVYGKQYAGFGWRLP